MRITLLRHATIIVELGGRRILVDPMLDPAGARAPVRGTPEPRPNPLVPLPVTPEEAVAGVDAVMLTHTHEDHLDAAGVTALPRHLPFFCQPEDLPELTPLGFSGLRPLPDAPAAWEGLNLARTRGRHAHDDRMAAGLGPVSGVALSAPGEPAVLVAGDTVWCPELDAAIAAHRPQWIVVNAGAARFVEGGLITMGAEDVITVARAAPGAIVVAVHMEAINHCLESRADLAGAVAAAGLAGRVLIPADGESVGG